MSPLPAEANYDLRHHRTDCWTEIVHFPLSGWLCRGESGLGQLLPLALADRSFFETVLASRNTS